MNFKVTFTEEAPELNVKFGWSSGEFEAGKAAGAQETYDWFWDIIQPTGRSIFMYMFTCWDWEYGDPKKPIVIDNANISIVGMFYYCMKLKAINAEKFDFVNVNAANNLFCWCWSLESVPKINLCSTNLTSAYANCYKLRMIGMLDVSRITVINGLNDTFKNCYALEDIGEIRGQISQNGLNLQWSKTLNKETFIRIVNALSPETNGLTVTFSKTAKEANFTESEWAALIGTKSNWTIALA